ncbi:MAG: protein kinase [Planctomycetaceae bacterium]|nr:protein kinase [Planctomycetaceae bacterium]
MSQSINQLLKSRYHIVEQLGKGGMSTVYRGYDLVAQTNVAIKKFYVNREGAIARGSYRVEIDSLKGLKHKHIVELLDDGEDDEGNPFLVLELLENDLRVAKRSNPSSFKSWKTVFESIAMPILDAVEFGHLKGITHRDISPGNILLKNPSIVKLADFGIARIKGRLNAGITLREYRTEPFAPPERDDGSNSDSRDIFSFAAVVVWALHTDEITSYEELYSAATKIDVPSELKDILKRCLARSPRERFENGVLLKIACDAFWTKFLLSNTNPRSMFARIVTTRKAQQCLSELIDMEQNEFVENDINNSPTISKFVKEGKPVANHYVVLGGRLSYHVMFAEDSREILVMHVSETDPGSLLRRKDSQPDPRIRFTFNMLSARVGFEAAFDTIESAISEHKWDTDSNEREVEPFVDLCTRILDAKQDLEQVRQPPVNYSELELDGRIVTVHVDEPNRFVERELWQIKSRNYTTLLNVLQRSESEVVFSLASKFVNPKFAASGKLQRDIGGAKAILDRQQTALQRLGSNSTANPKLRDYLSLQQSPPEPKVVDLGFALAGELDLPKRKAIASVLAEQSMIVVPGPPGTGKTRFIAFLIHAFKQKHPNAKILLTAQTHVAVDNALEKISEIAPGLRLLRVAADNSDVSPKLNRFLIESQMEIWRNDVDAASDRWIRKLAETKNVDVEEVTLGCDLREFASLRERILKVSVELQSVRSTRQELASLPLDTRSAEEELSLVTEKFHRLRDEEAHLRSELDGVSKRIQSSKYYTSELLDRSFSDLSEWADALIGKSVSDEMVREAIKLRSEWLAVFGTNSTFNAAMCERADVVAGTCVGFAGLRDTEPVDYDLCIVDEASKATVLETLVPLVRGRQWVLVGDAKQLPPFREYFDDAADVLAQHNVSESVLSESLFPQLQKQLPVGCVHTLTNQYRMNKPIGELVSSCFYPGVLNPGERSPNPELFRIYNAAVAWFSTSTIDDRGERRSRTSWENSRERQIIIDQLVKINSAVKSQHTVLVISPYSAQVEALQDAVSASRDRLRNLLIECSTVDAVQGKEAKIVFYSLTRTRATEFVDDVHRVNVALSRAEELLIIVGDERAYRESKDCEHLQRVIQHINKSSDTCRIITQLFGQQL